MDIKEKRRLRLQEWFADKTLPIKDKSYISQIVTGKSGLGEKGAARLEREYNMPSGYLTTPNLKSIAPNQSLLLTSKKYPVLNAIQAKSWTTTLGDTLTNSTYQWLESEEPTIGDAFWLKIENESMTAPTGLSISEGSFVLFDTGKKATNGSLVLTDMGENHTITFKKLIIDSGKGFLKALNPMWPSVIPLDHQCKIIAVAIEAKIRLTP